MPKIINFRENCIGCNSCVELSPNNWEMDSADGKSRLKLGVCKKDVSIVEICDFEVDANKFAAQACPMGIIRVLADDGVDITQS